MIDKLDWITTDERSFDIFDRLPNMEYNVLQWRILREKLRLTGYTDLILDVLVPLYVKKGRGTNKSELYSLLSMDKDGKPILGIDGKPIMGRTRIKNAIDLLVQQDVIFLSKGSLYPNENFLHGSKTSDLMTRLFHEYAQKSIRSAEAKRDGEVSKNRQERIQKLRDRISQARAEAA